MRLTALLAALTFLTLAFAGCSDGGGDGEDTTTSSTSTSASATTSSSSSSSSASATTSASSSSTETSGPSNSPPTGSISASVNGTNVTFTLTGSDPDGDTLVWELDFGDGQKEDGTTLPATVEHVYAVGNYTANFTVTDGTDPKTYDVEVAVAALAGGGAGGQVVTFTGTIVAPDPFAVTAGTCILVLMSSQAPQETFGGSFAAAGVQGWSYSFDVTGVITLFVDGADNPIPGGESGSVPEAAVTIYTCGASEDAVMLDYTLSLVPPA